MEPARWCGHGVCHPGGESSILSAGSPRQAKAPAIAGAQPQGLSPAKQVNARRKARQGRKRCVHPCEQVRASRGVNRQHLGAATGECYRGITVTMPTFASRGEARRFFVGTGLFFAGVALSLAYVLLSLSRGTRIVETNWFFVSEGALGLVFIGGAIRTGPVRRATLPPSQQRGFVNPFRRTGLYSRAGIRDAFRVARSGPRGKPARPADWPTLFSGRSDAGLYLLAILMIPAGLVLSMVLSIVFAGTGPKNPTPGWIGALTLISVAGFALLLRRIRQFSREQAGEGSTGSRAATPWQRGWSFYLSSDGMKDAIRVARGR